MRVLSLGHLSMTCFRNALRAGKSGHSFCWFTSDPAATSAADSLSPKARPARYPKELTRIIRTKAGEVLVLRPIKAKDQEALREAFTHLTPEDVRMRFFGPMKELKQPLAAQLAQVDYEREMAFVAARRTLFKQEIWGVVRAIINQNGAAGGRSAEFAIVVRSDKKGSGLGHELMARIEDYCRSRQVSEIRGQILAENRPMLHLVKDLGYQTATTSDEPGIVLVRKYIGNQPSEAADL